MRLLAILVIVFSVSLCCVAVVEELAVQVPQGEYEFWLEWWVQTGPNEASATEGKHTKATGAQFKVQLGEVPAKAKASTLLVLNLRSGLLAHGETGAGRTLSLSEADFHLIPELKVTVRVPAEEDHLLAQVMLEQGGVQGTGLVWITGRKGETSFAEVDVLVPARIRVSALGYRDYEMPVTLVDADKKAIPVIEVGLTKAAPAPPPPVEAPPERTGWFTFFIIAVMATGLASLALATLSVVRGDSALPTSSRMWLLSVLGPPLVGLVGWWMSEAIGMVVGEFEDRWVVLLPIAAWAFLLMSMTAARARLLSGSALLGTAACASAGLASLSPSDGGLFWSVFLFTALTLVSSLVGGFIVAFGRPALAQAQPSRAPEADICPYCGQRKDPITGACSCTPGQRRAGEARLVVEQGERTGETFSVGDRFSIGREAGNDLVLADMTVSRRHCVILREGGGVIVRDEGSANGTLVNGERVSEKRLSPGDRIQVGSTVIGFEE